MSLLMANQGKKVSTLLPQLVTLMYSERSNGGNAFYNAESGALVGHFCYFHKIYEPVGAAAGQAEYGSKVNTSTGLNTMCKVGANSFSSRNSTYKQNRANVMIRMMAQPPEITIDEARPILEQIEKDKIAVIPREDKVGFKTLDELTKHLGVTLTTVKPVKEPSIA